MLDHVGVAVSDLAASERFYRTVLSVLGLEPSYAGADMVGWDDWWIGPADREHPLTRGLHVGFRAPDRAAVDAFWQAGIDAGFTDNGTAGPRPDYADDYYAAFLQDSAGDNFEAVYRDGARPKGSIDHVGLRVHDIEASTAFYTTIAATAGLTLRRQASDRASFTVGSSDGVLSVVAGEPTENVHLAFSGDDDDVRRFHAEAIAAGYRSNGEPGERARYHPGYYAAYVLDPDGNNVEVVNHHRS